MGIETFRRYKRTCLPSGRFSVDLCAAYTEVFNMQILTDLYTDEVCTFPSVGPTVQALRKQTLRRNTRDIHGGAVVKTSPSNAGGPGSVPSHSQKTKTRKNRNTILANSLKTLKMFLIKIK